MNARFGDYLKPHNQLRPFSVPDRKEARLRGIESIARAVADFASIVEQQPVQFTLLWKASGAPSSVGVGISPRLMDTALYIERNDGRELKVCVVVFPRLRKQVGFDSVLLAKLQVLLF